MNRYLNVKRHALIDNLMKKFEVYVVGLVHIKIKCNAEQTKLYVVRLVHRKIKYNAKQTKLYVENKLEEFKIDSKTDVISLTHDGATVMVKYGRILGIIS